MVISSKSKADETDFSKVGANPIDLGFWVFSIVIAYFTTHDKSHIYGLPYPSTDSLDPMDQYCTFDVSKIIPKNTCYLLYATFNPFLTYIHGY